MSIGATEHHGNDPHTDHYNESQHFNNKLDDYKAHNDGVSEHKHQPDHWDGLNNNKQQQQDDDSYSESDHQHNEQYNLIGNDAPESSAEWSNNSSKELDNYNNIGKSVFFQNNSLLTWNTKTAPKIFVHCNVQHAFMVATNPAGSSEGSSSCSASTKKKMSTCYSGVREM